MKRTIRLTESDLHNLIKESVNKVLNEARVVDYKERVMSLINAANNAYNEVAETGSDYPLMDKKGNSYGLKGEITLDARGYVIIPFEDGTRGWGDYSDTERIRVLRKVNGQIQIIPGDYFEEGWRDVQKKLKQIIRDAQIGKQYSQNYDPSWEDSETSEEYKMNRSNLENMNRKIGRNINAGSEYIKR